MAKRSKVCRQMKIHSLAIPRIASHNGAPEKNTLSIQLVNIMNNSVDDLLPAHLVVEIAQKTKQSTTLGIAQACICHLIDNNESGLMRSGLTLIDVKKYVRSLNI